MTASVVSLSTYKAKKAMLPWPTPWMWLWRHLAEGSVVPADTSAPETAPDLKTES